MQEITFAVPKSGPKARPAPGREDAAAVTPAERRSSDRRREDDFGAVVDAEERAADKKPAADAGKAEAAPAAETVAPTDEDAAPSEASAPVKLLIALATAAGALTFGAAASLNVGADDLGSGSAPVQFVLQDQREGLQARLLGGLGLQDAGIECGADPGQAQCAQRTVDLHHAHGHSELLSLINGCWALCCAPRVNRSA